MRRRKWSAARATSCASMIDVQIENHAGPAFARPGQCGLMFRFDEADRAVDEVDAIHAEIAAHVVHERQQPGSGHVEFGDHLAAAYCGAEPVIERAVVVLEVEIELVRIAPVQLPVRCEVELGELRGRRRVCRLCARRQQPAPVVLREPYAGRQGYRPIVGRRPVARKHAGAQEVGAVGRGCELEIAVQVAGRQCARQRLRSARRSRAVPRSRSTFTRGTSRSVAAVTTPNNPYPPTTWRNKSGCSATAAAQSLHPLASPPRGLRCPRRRAER